MQIRKIREVGEVLSDSFLFIKEEIKPIWKLSLRYVLPFFLIFTYVQITFQQKMVGLDIPEDPEYLIESLKPLYKNIFIVSSFNIFVQSLFMALVYSYIALYAEKGKGNFTLQDVTDRLFSNSLMLLGVVLVAIIISSIGLMLCFLPGIYFANTFSVAAIAIVVEKKGVGHALARSWKLVNFQWLNTFVVNLVGLLFLLATGFALSIPAMVSGISTSLAGSLQGQTIEYPTWYWIMLGITTVISSFLYIVPYVFIAFQYFNLIERGKKEGLLPEE